VKVRFGITRKDLSTALDKTAKALSSAPTESVLKNFLIEAVPDGIWVSASDKVVTMSTFVETYVDTPGRMLLPAAKILELVRKASGANLAIGLNDDDSAMLICGMSRWNIPTRSVGTYPETGVDGFDAEIHDVGMLELYPAILSVRKAMAVSLSGLAQISIKKGKVRAADGVWFQEAPLPGAPDLEIGIPYVAVDDALSFLARGKGKVAVVLTDTKVVAFRIGNDLMTFPLPVHPAPNLDKAFTAPLMTNKDDLTISRTDLKAAISRVAITADSETQAISLALSAATVDSVVVSSKSRDGSWSDEPVHCKWVGDTRKILLHREYIFNALNSFTSDFVTFKLGPDAPANPSQVLIQAEGKTSVLNQLRADLI
jgi:DNA polymerase-3 subunit beta